MPTPAQTWALVVGIDDHREQPDWKLHGPVADAIRFCTWLRNHHVPIAQISLHLAPSGDSTIGGIPAGLIHQPATSTVIRDWLTQCLPDADGTTLIIFWGGHGIIDHDHTRRLICADASEKDARNFDLANLRSYLLGSKLKPKAFLQQYLIIDTCAEYAAHFSKPIELPRIELAVGLASKGKSQTVFLAASRGQVARNLNALETGLFSREFLIKLPSVPAQAWPFDQQLMRRELVAYFTQLRDQRQVAAFLEHIGDSSDEETICGCPPSWKSFITSLDRENHNEFSDQDLATLHGIVSRSPLLRNATARHQLLAALGQKVDAAYTADARGVAWQIIYGTCDATPSLFRLLDLLSHPDFSVPVAVYGVLDRMTRLQFEWKAIHQLMMITDRLEVVPSAPEIWTARRGALERYDHQPEGASARRLLRLCIEEMVQILPNEVETEHPLARFLGSLNVLLLAPNLHIKKWLKATFGGGLAAPTSLRGGTAVLQVCFHPTRDLATGENRFQAAVTLWPDGLTGSPGNLSGDAAADSLTIEAIEPRVHSWIRQAVSQISKNRELRIEAILPNSLLHLNPDEWRGSEDVTDDPIGQHYPLILRSRDRLFHGHYWQAQRIWQEKWTTVGARVEAGHCLWNWAGPAPTTNPESLRTKQVLFTYFPLPISQESQQHNLGLAVKAGLPLAFWLRGEGDAHLQAEIAKRFVEVPPHRWPSRGRTLRQEMAINFSLLWDNPNNLPPGTNHQLTAPA